MKKLLAGLLIAASTGQTSAQVTAEIQGYYIDKNNETKKFQFQNTFEDEDALKGISSDALRNALLNGSNAPKDLRGLNALAQIFDADNNLVVWFSGKVS